MKKRFVWLGLALVIGCGSKGGGGEVIAKLAELEKAMCACQDEACAAKVRGELKQYETGDVMKKPTDQEMSTIMASEHKIDECERRYVLDEVGTLLLDQMKTGLKDVRDMIAAGKYTSATMRCDKSNLEKFKKTYSGYAAKPEVGRFLDEYGAFCSVGMHVDAATKVVAAAEAARATKPDGFLSECNSADMIMAELKLKEAPDGLQKLAPLKERLAKVCK